MRSLPWLICLGCVPLDGPVGSVELPDVPSPCASPLLLTPANASTTPRGLIQLHVVGGSGVHHFEREGDADGLLNRDNGSWLAGTTPGTHDIVHVVDAVCEASARAELHVVEALDVQPRTAAIVPGGALTFRWTGGTATPTCTLVTDATGAQLTEACVYQAGPQPGQDTVRFTDPGTGDTLDVWVEVDAANTLALEGRGGLFLPTYADYRLRPHHGSGRVEATVLEGPFVADGDEVTATAAGHGRLSVRDLHTGERVEVDLVGLAPLLPSATRDGERSSQGVLRALGDVDGDGWVDAALGFIEPSIDAHYGGLVAVYAGGPTGLRPQPVLVLPGRGDTDTAGRAVASADLDNDGEPELIVGTDRADRGATNNGAVRLYRGVPGGFFEAEPYQTLCGLQSYERLGAALVTCDFDGDVWQDMAVGASEATDRGVGVPAEDQGGVYVYRGGPAGFAERADFVLYGVDVHGDPARDTELGMALAAGDLDGDGLCDLAAGAPEAQGEDGLVLLYRGTTTDGLLLSRAPVGSVSGSHRSELGRRLAVADLDGAAELAATAWKTDPHGTDSGSVYVFDAPLGRDLGVADAAWQAHGTVASDFLGSDLDLADLDGDGDADVVVGAYRAEDGDYGQGLVLGWTDPVLDGRDASGTADHTWRGAERYDRFGQAAAVLGDVDDDGTSDLVVLSGFSHLHGIEAGRLDFVDGASGTLSSLDLPGDPAGHSMGQALALADVDGDGTVDVVAGSPGAGDPAVGANAGIVNAWTGHNAPERFAGGHPTHSGSDRFGEALTTTDFDGDGYDDLVVVARSDYRPSSVDDTVFVGATCLGSRASAGLVQVFLGGPDGLDPEPAFAWWGPESSGYVRRAVGGFDHDGDGRQDVALASNDWGVGGGFLILHGRDPDPAGTTVLCEDDPYLAHSEFDRLGDGLGALGDLDGDGCDELGVGATGETLGRDWNNQGVLRIFWGTCSGPPSVTALAVEVIGTELGRSVDGGEDVDGDGIPDVVVGGSRYRVQFAEHGVAWVVPGSWIREQPRQSVADGLPAPDDTQWWPLLPEQGLEDRYGVVGPTAGGAFGTAVALVPSRDGVLVAVGHPIGSTAAEPLTGGVYLYRWDGSSGGLDPLPWQIVGGESTPGGLGEALASGADRLVVGAPTSDAAGLDLGAAYVVPTR